VVYFALLWDLWRYTVALRTGIVILTLLVEHICRLLATYRTAMNAVIAAAVTGGSITSAQATVIGDWLDAASAACVVLKSITGY
jgi:hypothetical protein